MNNQIGTRQQVWVVLIGGFTQRDYRENGLQRLWMKLNRVAVPMTHVALREWTVNTSRLAQRIWLVSRYDESPPIIIVVGYSYGGQTAVNFCRDLARRGLMVESLVLCDAVFRWLRVLPTLSSLFSFWRIRVPRNVRMVRWFYQRMSIPFGHRVVRDDPEQTAFWNNEFFGKELEAGHVYVDDNLEFHTHVLAQFMRYASHAE